MPIYEYVCNTCSHELEVIQSFREKPLTQCPACDEISLRKKMSVAAFHLKGTGWYETDFKNKSKPPERKDEAKKSEKGESTGASQDSAAKPVKSKNKTESSASTATA